MYGLPGNTVGVWELPAAEQLGIARLAGSRHKVEGPA
jgi:hypothetical protein